MFIAKYPPQILVGSPEHFMSHKPSDNDDNGGAFSPQKHSDLKLQENKISEIS